MKNATIFLLGLAALLLAPTRGYGQGCRLLLTPHFSSYSTSTRDGYKIYTSVTISGYASVGSGAGCNMSVATHHVVATNTLNNVVHSTSSANGCPTCYFTATDNEQINADDPGVVYPFEGEGSAICSLAGNFFGEPGGGSLPSCLTPLDETIVSGLVDQANYGVDYIQEVSDTDDDNFDGESVKEVSPPGTGTNSCYWADSGQSPNPQVTGTTWLIGTIVGSPGTFQNEYGPDIFNFPQKGAQTIANEGGANHVTFPCVMTIIQEMNVVCYGGVLVAYITNPLTITIDPSKNDIEFCKVDTCESLNIFD